jgi:hypothetical protein
MATEAGATGVGADAEQGRALKTGYLLKRPSLRRNGGGLRLFSAAKRKFFVLREGSLCYYRDHHCVDAPGACSEVLLTAECDVADFADLPSAPFGLCITAGDKVREAMVSSRA